MSEFKVGDKVEFTEAFGGYLKGEVVEITGVDNEVTFPYVDYKGEKSDGWVHQRRLKKVESKPTKNQRITSLEETVEQKQNEINELKVIVHQLRENGLPSTVLSVEDESEIIEFEGAKYRKVDRLAREGDVVIVHKIGLEGSPVEVNKPYLVNNVDRGVLGHHDGITTNRCSFDIYAFGRTSENVEVYELIKEGELPFEPFDDSEDLPYEPTPNELRAEIIEKAKGFVEEEAGTVFEFISQGDKILVLNNEDKSFAESKCNPSDVFNEHIGKAIALGRALGLDVSEFEQAVQPTEVVVGMYISTKGYGVKKVVSMDGEVDTTGNSCCLLSLMTTRYKEKIINDTNAQYGGVE